VWLRLARLTGQAPYREAAERALRYLMAAQDLDARDPGVRGGVKGSQPIWGGYAAWEYLNWAAKFLADALLLHLGADLGRPAACEGLA